MAFSKIFADSLMIGGAPVRGSLATVMHRNAAEGHPAALV